MNKPWPQPLSHRGYRGPPEATERVRRGVEWAYTPQSPQYAAAGLAHCAAVSSRSTAAGLSSSCATDEAPTSGITGTSPPISQASTTWLAVAPVSAATARKAESRGGVPAWSNSAPSGRSGRS